MLGFFCHHKMELTNALSVSTIDSWLFFLLLWLQWTQIPNLPVPHISSTCLSAVHTGWLYIITQSKSAGVVMYRTQNKRDWEKIPSPPNTLYCQGMLSHNSRLFILSEPPKTPYLDRHLMLHELLEVNGRLEWRAVPNARCPIQYLYPAFFGVGRLFPAFFGVGNSLVLAGGRSSTKPWPTTCSEYDLHGNNWVEATTWPALPKQMTSPTSVVVGDYVYLIGGSDETSLSIKDVFSISVKDGRAAGPWLVNALPATPLDLCAACHVYGNLVVAGGANQSRSVFVFDSSSNKWLKLPELSIGRCRPNLVHFGESLVTAGGYINVGGGAFTNQVEELSLPTI